MWKASRSSLKHSSSCSPYYSRRLETGLDAVISGISRNTSTEFGFGQWEIVCISCVLWFPPGKSLSVLADCILSRIKGVCLLAFGLFRRLNIERYQSHPSAARSTMSSFHPLDRISLSGRCKLLKVWKVHDQAKFSLYYYDYDYFIFFNLQADRDGPYLWSLGLPAPTVELPFDVITRGVLYGARLNFLHIWVRISFTVNEAVFVLRSFFPFFVRGDRGGKVDSHTHEWSVGKSSALLTTRTPGLLRASAVTYLFSKFPARKFEWNSPGILQHRPKINHQQYFIQKYVLINRQNKQKCTMDEDSLKKSRWNKSTLNCNVPLRGYSRTYRYAFIYVYIYIYISTLAEKFLEIYISSSERLKEGLRAWPEHAHTHSHIKHTRAPGFVGVGHITSLRRAFEVGGSSKNPFGL